jgi:hypothetical protein
MEYKRPAPFSMTAALINAVDTPVAIPVSTTNSRRNARTNP